MYKGYGHFSSQKVLLHFLNFWLRPNFRDTTSLVYVVLFRCKIGERVFRGPSLSNYLPLSVRVIGLVRSLFYYLLKGCKGYSDPSKMILYVHFRHIVWMNFYIYVFRFYFMNLIVYINTKNFLYNYRVTLVHSDSPSVTLPILRPTRRSEGPKFKTGKVSDTPESE